MKVKIYLNGNYSIVEMQQEEIEKNLNELFQRYNESLSDNNRIPKVK